MASSSSSSSSRILSLKALLISLAVVSAAVTLKLTVPLMFNALPAIWSVAVTWLKPPYLYVVINEIIITIAASSCFQQNHHQENQSQPQVNYSTPNAHPPSDLTSHLPAVSIPLSFGVIEPSPVSFGVQPSVTVEPPVVYERKQFDLDLEAITEIKKLERKIK
ncbi:hypothetical protein SSX86_025022 [Deinandra increscens subsp. villosa]|uniref:DUF4408 domain-containing protein n=1 Tax=Deinandra increscens subsp. villosa TaxID=3103831 RepID=A0AAP0CHR4_9ASTR